MNATSDNAAGADQTKPRRLIIRGGVTVAVDETLTGPDIAAAIERGNTVTTEQLGGIFGRFMEAASTPASPSQGQRPGRQRQIKRAVRR